MRRPMIALSPQSTMLFGRRLPRSNLNVAQFPCALRASVTASYGHAPSRDATHIPARSATDVPLSCATRGASQSAQSNQYDTRLLRRLAVVEYDLDDDDRTARDPSSGARSSDEIQQLAAAESPGHADVPGLPVCSGGRAATEGAPARQRRRGNACCQERTHCLGDPGAWNGISARGAHGGCGPT